MENKVNCDSFPEKDDVLKELTILKSQDKMAQILILHEIENDNQVNDSKESAFNLINLPHSNLDPD